MHDHYEYKVFRRRPDGGEQEFFGEYCLPTAESCRKDFMRRFGARLAAVRCIIRNSCGYVDVATKGYGKYYFRHMPDTGWHVNK